MTRRTKQLLIFSTVLVAIYATIRIFFTPPLLSDAMFSHAYFDTDGKLMRITLTPDEKYRLYTPLDKISPHIQRATILYEDKYFYYHPGVNPVALFRAVANYIQPDTRPIGASTITMQVARLKYNMDTTRPAGKLKQIAAAFYIDAFYSKDEILTAYLNLAPYGGNVEGIGAASLIYFNQMPDTLSKISAITLATVPQNPVKRGLNTPRGIENMGHMRVDLARRWAAQYPNDADLVEIAKMPIDVRGIRDLPFDAPHFTDALIHDASYEFSNTHNSYVHTTLDMNIQKNMTRALTNQINRRREYGVTNAAAILLNYKTMETVAYIGSADYFDKSIYGENDGVRARRSPGSTLKPLIYATATDMGFIHPMTLMRDAPINFGTYAPENADSEFYGPVLARDALTHSRNIPAITLVQKIGLNRFYKILTDSGVTNLRNPAHYGVSIALGGAEVSMHELANIYATMANLGTRYDIRDTHDSALISKANLLSPEAFFLTLDMLSHQATPTKKIPFANQRPTTTIRHYWKTGTSSSFRDAWTAGIFGDYVLIVWVGNFDGTTNNIFSGAKTAAPIYFALADTVINYHANRGTPVQNNNFYRDDLNVSEIDMCDAVGGIAGTNCPNKIKSYFIPGVSPIDVSPVYRAVAIDNATGRRACHYNPDTTHMAVYEFWDSEFLDMFNRAGIHRNTPPPFMENCDLDSIINTRPAPVITSPANDTKIVIVSDTDTAPIAYQAISDLKTAKIFWFIDDEYIGTTISGETITHPASMGHHTIRIMDEMGGGTTTEFTVIK